MSNKRVLLIFPILLFFFISIFAETQFNHSRDQPENIRFRHLTIKDGLSNNGVRTIYQDKLGFMWLGTWDGLHRYDGYNFKIYRNDLENPNSLSDNLISAILENEDGTFWIGTGAGGLNHFDPFTETFTRFPHGKDSTNSLRGNFILDIHRDQDGYLWMATFDGGLSRFDPKRKSFINYHHIADNQNTVGSDSAFFIESDLSGNIWISTFGGGLTRLNPKTGTFTRFQENKASSTGLKSNKVRTLYMDRQNRLWVSMSGGHLQVFNPTTEKFERYFKFSKNIFAIHQDSRGEMWVGTNGDGLFHLDDSTGTTTNYKNEETNPNSLSNNVLWTIFEDRSGNLWAGSMEGGANLFTVSPSPFKHITPTPKNAGSIDDKRIRAFLTDSNGSLWVGTAKGINRQSKDSRKYDQILANLPDKLAKGINFSAIHEDKEGIIWIGGWYSGLIRYNPKTRQFKQYLQDTYNPDSLRHNNVFDIHEDNKENLWLATDLGLHKFDKISEKFTIYQYAKTHPNNIPENHVLKIHEDSSGILWLASWYSGLSSFNPDTGKHTRFRSEAQNKNSPASNAVYSLYEDKNNNLWLGTSRGLNKFNKTTQTFTRYSTKQGLPNDVIWCITGDQKNNLWISTNKGLSRFDFNQETFTNYDITHGLQGNQFTEGACYKDRDGQLFFGGINGYNAFYPSSIEKNQYKPPVMLTDFRLFNQSVKASNESPLQSPIWNTKKLQLTYQDSVISFDFAALNYFFPERNTYEYMLEGFDPGWNKVKSDRRSATYTSLPAGDYLFRVRAMNNDGLLSDKEVSLEITITPPWWNTLLFKITLLIIFVGTSAGIFRWRVYSIKKHNVLLEKEVIKRTEELELSSTRYKELFENMSSGAAVLEPIDNAEDFIIKEANHAAGKIYALKHNDIINQRLSNVIPTLRDSGLFSVYQRIARTGGIEFTPSTAVVRDDKTIWRESWIYRLPSGEVVSVFNDISKRLEIEKEREKLIQDLQAALEEIKSLRGILPLCSFCNKIRDDKGYWDKVDVYIHKHSEAQVSHSICPDCLEQHYPEFSDEE